MGNQTSTEAFPPLGGMTGSYDGDVAVIVVLVIVAVAICIVLMCIRC